ncbi:metallophosphoesterase [Herbiconiux sp. CPCC 203407]|uniref:Phosphoesterase n=1 Tax=Herbiconiux oxytropis TaxID=2970915 RepID=A0AA41XGH6_9MICO|nr:metallophosphoesterase [Herbiconiux oxytropis]MCS5723738.1 metallophosphoesterase [Herbiconiux oxytropis]MCS5725238.1 metallophosphoesterase [Herbiconiux oxytropis]
MPTRLLLLADTHVPKRARRLPDAVWRQVDRADVVLHAGDWVDVGTLDLLEDRAARLVGVHGNNDGAELRARLPEVARVELEGVRIATVHETGSAAGRETRMDAAFPRSGSGSGSGSGGGADVLVFGHSHIPWDTTSPAGLRLLNPGSPTDRRRQPVCTLMTAVADDGVLTEVELLPVARD